MTAVRWGILGTANIASALFLPALERQGGAATVVGSRDRERASQWALRNSVGRGVEGYEAVLEAPDVDCIYIPLPNSDHIEWASKALAAGKPVLCEKPLTTSSSDTQALVSAETGTPLWEAFVFPFHPQSEAIRNIVDNGEIGAIREVQSTFHVRLEDSGNIRKQVDKGGGATYDLGVYPVHFTRLLLGMEPDYCSSTVLVGPTGIDEEVAAVLGFPDTSRLVMSAGFIARYTSLTRVIGEHGELRIDNAWHPAHDNGVELWRPPEDDWHSGRFVWRQQTGTALTGFDYLLDHIMRVYREEEEPRHLAREDSPGTAKVAESILSSPHQVSGQGASDS